LRAVLQLVANSRGDAQQVYPWSHQRVEGW
jgi:hypothetical protein